MLRDSGNQSIFWTSFSGVLAWLGDQQNLALISLAVGIFTAVVNMYSKCREGQAQANREKQEALVIANRERREEEIHQIKMERLRRGLVDNE